MGELVKIRLYHSILESNMRPFITNMCQQHEQPN